VAADSATRRGSHETSDFCKIQQAGTTFLAFSGNPDIAASVNNRPDPQLSFRGFDLAKDAAKLPDTMAEKGTAFEKKAKTAFQRAVALMKQYNPEVCKQFVLRPQALEVVFFGLNPDKVPALYVVGFSVSEDARGRVVVAPHNFACPGKDCDPRSPYIEILGVNDEAISAQKKPGFYTGRWENDVRRLIEIETIDNLNSSDRRLMFLRCPSWGAYGFPESPSARRIQTQGGTRMPSRKKIDL
jgi:hypothetical protein